MDEVYLINEDMYRYGVSGFDDIEIVVRNVKTDAEARKEVEKFLLKLQEDDES